MKALVVLVGILAMASGTVKLLGRGRSLPGVGAFALLEMVGGVAVAFLVLSRDPDPGLGLTLVLLTLGLVAASTGVQIRQVRARRRHRQETEDARLYTFVKYLSKEVGDGSGAKTGEE